MSLQLGHGRAERGRPSSLRAVKTGDYVCSDRDLYRIEQLTGERALIEDCRDGTLIDVPLLDLLDLRPVRSA